MRRVGEGRHFRAARGTHFAAGGHHHFSGSGLIVGVIGALDNTGALVLPADDVAAVSGRHRARTVLSTAVGGVHLELVGDRLAIRAVAARHHAIAVVIQPVIIGLVNNQEAAVGQCNNLRAVLVVGRTLVDLLLGTDFVNAVGLIKLHVNFGSGSTVALPHHHDTAIGQTGGGRVELIARHRGVHLRTLVKQIVSAQRGAGDGDWLTFITRGISRRNGAIFSYAQRVRFDLPDTFSIRYG